MIYSLFVFNNWAHPHIFIHTICLVVNEARYNICFSFQFSRFDIFSVSFHSIWVYYQYECIGFHQNSTVKYVWTGVLLEKAKGAATQLVVCILICPKCKCYWQIIIPKVADLVNSNSFDPSIQRHLLMPLLQKKIYIVRFRFFIPLRRTLTSFSIVSTLVNHTWISAKPL